MRQEIQREQLNSNTNTDNNQTKNTKINRIKKKQNPSVRNVGAEAQKTQNRVKESTVSENRYACENSGY